MVALNSFGFVDQAAVVDCFSVWAEMIGETWTMRTLQDWYGNHQFGQAFNVSSKPFKPSKIVGKYGQIILAV